MELLVAFIRKHQGGSPTDASVYWIHLRPREIAAGFFASHAHRVSHGLVKRTLKSLGFRYRKLRKSLATGDCPYRNQQFQIIFDLVLLMNTQTPILSIDCKKKERLGTLYREGRLYATAAMKVFDHDYHYLAQGAVIPHGIYDMKTNTGYLSIGNSHETAEFIKDNLLWWWDHFGIHQYPDAQQILILCDAGGANSYRHHAFKKQMIQLAQIIGLDLIICHYPPYASKWNPIEHRLFAQVHHAIQGAMFTDYQMVKELFAKTTTQTGLKVVVRLNLHEYPIGIKTKKEEVDFKRIQFNQNIPQLSYRVCA